MRFFLLLALFFVVVWLIRGGRRGSRPESPAQGQVPPQADAESMVACRHCGVHLPQSEAVSGGAGWFCGEAHRVAHDATRAR